MIDDHNILYTDDTTDRNHKIVHIMVEDYQTIQNFLERFMEQYKIYTVPDEPYLRRLEEKARVEMEAFLAYYEDDLLQGVFAESFEEDEVYIRWAYSLKPEHMLNQSNNDTKVRRFISQKGIYSREIQQERILYKAKKYQRSWQGSRTLLLGGISCKERTILHSGYW